MHTEVTLDFAALYSFMVVLARVSGFIVLVPLPGFNAGPSAARVILAIALSICLAPFGPRVDGASRFGGLATWIAMEFLIGLVMSVGVMFLQEIFQIAAQAIGLQAGFSYASTIDPSTQADTAVLQTVVQLLAGILFFALGLDLQLIRLLTANMQAAPDTFGLSKAFHPETVMHLGTLAFNTGLRLAMPVIGSLLLVDLAFALLSKVQAQLQLLSFSFAVKMMAGLMLFAATMSWCPHLLENAAARVFEILSRSLG